MSHIKAERIRANDPEKGNYGYLVGEVGGIKYDGSEIIRSGKDDVDNELPQIFDAKVVNEEQVIDGKGGWLRNEDSEYLMLNRLANRLGAKRGEVRSEVKGILKIVSERKFCPSCEDVIRQFHEMFPNVELILVDNVYKKK